MENKTDLQYTCDTLNAVYNRQHTPSLEQYYRIIRKYLNKNCICDLLICL